jgi:peptidoglycan/LPS O-acetylase OafA/YrhL
MVSMREMSPHAPGYRPDIDGLRAVSILLVVGFHAGLGIFAGGYVGVDVFFVLSGYLITGLLVAEYRRANRISLLDFYARRVRRLLPLAFLVIVTTTAVGYVLSVPLRRGELIGDARASSLYMANWRFAGQATAYSDVEVSESLFLHFWSLSIEEQFYLFWPALIVIVGLVCRRMGTRRFSSVLLAVIGGLVLFSLGASVVTTSRGPDTYFFTHLRLWELGVGAGMALLVPLLPRLRRPLAETLAFAGLVMICVAAVTFDAATVFPGYAALLPVLGCALLVSVGAGQTTVLSTALSLPPMTYVGRISYGWYLWHWPVIGIGLLLSDRAANPWPPGVVIATAVVVSFGLAAASHVLVEQPVRRAPRLSAQPRRALAIGAMLTITPVLLGVMLLTQDQPTAVAVASPAIASNEAGAMHDPGVTPPTGSPGMTPAQAAEDHSALPPDECHASFRDSTAPAGCIYGTTDADTTIVLVGDSHGQQWLPALDQAGRDRGWAVMSWSKSSCTVIDVPLRNDRLEREYHECLEWRNAILENLIERGHVDLIVIADSYNYGGMVLSDDGELFEDQALLLAAWRAGASKTLEDYSQVTDRVVLLRDTPWSRRNVPDCLSEDPTTPERCAFSLEGRAWLDEAYLAEELNAGGDFVEAIDMTRFICETDPCSIVTGNGIIKYRDGHHLTATFSRSLSGSLGNAIEMLLNRPLASASGT